MVSQLLLHTRLLVAMLLLIGCSIATAAADDSVSDDSAEVSNAAQLESDAADTDDHDHADHDDGDHEHDAAGHGSADGHGGGHDGEHASDPSGLLSANIGQMLANLAIFGLTFFILAKFVWPVILDGLQSREESIRGDLDAAARDKDEAQRLRAELQAELDAAHTQAQAIISDATKSAETRAAQIESDAKDAADRRVARAEDEIATAKRAALAEMADQTSGIAMSLARQVVGRELNEGDHADLIRQSLEQFPSNN
ncbi:MAG: F0F1 ATP synthase subunit B [Planctomycetota bacterium]